MKIQNGCRNAGLYCTQSTTDRLTNGPVVKSFAEVDGCAITVGTLYDGDEG